MNAFTYCSKLPEMKQRIKQIYLRLETLRSGRAGTGNHGFSDSRRSNARTNSPHAGRTLEIVDLEKEVQSLEMLALCLYGELKETFRLFPHDVRKAASERFIGGKSAETVAEIMKITPENAMRLINKSLIMFANIRQKELETDGIFGLSRADLEARYKQELIKAGVLELSV